MVLSWAVRFFGDERPMSIDISLGLSSAAHLGPCQAVDQRAQAGLVGEAPPGCDVEGAARIPKGLRPAAGRGEEMGEAREGGAEVGVPKIERALLDLQRAPEERLRLLEL